MNKKLLVLLVSFFIPSVVSDSNDGVYGYSEDASESDSSLEMPVSGQTSAADGVTAQTNIVEEVRE